MKRLTILLLSALYAASLGAASPKVAFDSEQTPLQKAIQKTNRDRAAKKNQKLTGEKKDKCTEAL